MPLQIDMFSQAPRQTENVNFNPISYFCQNTEALTEDAIKNLLMGTNLNSRQNVEKILLDLALFNWECCKHIVNFRSKAIKDNSYPRQDLWAMQSDFMQSLKEIVLFHQKLNTSKKLKK